MIGVNKDPDRGRHVYGWVPYNADVHGFVLVLIIYVVTGVAEHVAQPLHLKHCTIMKALCATPAWAHVPCLHVQVSVWVRAVPP